MADEKKSETLYAVSMVIGPHPGRLVMAADEKSAADWYRKEYRIAPAVELHIVKAT